MKEFLFVFHGKHDVWNKKSEQQWQDLGRQHATWMKKIKDNFVTSGKLASKMSKIIEGLEAPAIMDGPFTKTKEVLTGFYIIKADHMNHAIDLAKGNPWLLHDRMEIFEIET